MASEAGTDRQRCAFVVKKKNRQCRMLSLKGSTFCGEHVLTDKTSSLNSTENLLRIKCPLDGTHTCFAKNLQRHLRVCNARVTRLPAYHVQDVNAGEGAPPSPGRTIHQLGDDELTTLLSRLERLHQVHVSPPEVADAWHPVLESSLQDAQLGPDTLRHLRQNSAILGLMQHHQLLAAPSTYVELGSGKAHLSSWLARAVGSDAQIVLVDRASHRHKAENKLKDLSDICAIQRLKIDIRHLWLAGCQACINRPVVVISKHLCGAATDLGLRAAVAAPSPRQPTALPTEPVSAQLGPTAAQLGPTTAMMGPTTAQLGQPQDDKQAEPATGTEAETESKTEHQSEGTNTASADVGVSESPLQVQAILIALCCHHRLDWSSYVGKQFLQECGLSAADLPALRGVAAWATCSTPSWSSPLSKRRRTAPAADAAGVTGGSSALSAEVIEGSPAVSPEVREDTSTDTPVETKTGASPSDVIAAQVRTGGTEDSTTVGDAEPELGLSASDVTRERRRRCSGTAGGSGDADVMAATAAEVADNQTSWRRYQRLGLSPERRTQLGFLCKRLLDEGRRRFLETHGFRARLVQFVPSEVSPENVLLLATRPIPRS